MRNNMTEKYRAKRKYGGDWVVGRYVPPGHYFGDGGTHAIEYANREDDDALPISMDIIYPDTLSRYSGLTACGQEVYEGDIVRFHIDHTAEFWTAVVRFGWHDTYEYGWYLEPIRDTVFTKAIGVWLGENAAFGTTTVAVIGNVWDNPEMMEVKT